MKSFEKLPVSVVCGLHETSWQVRSANETLTFAGRRYLSMARQTFAG